MIAIGAMMLNSIDSYVLLILGLLRAKKKLTIINKSNPRRIMKNICRNRYVFVIMMHNSDNDPL